MERLFRKAAFGGFNKEDVMQYIETMKTEFFDYKAQVEETIRNLNEKLASFEQAGGSATNDFAVSPTECDPAMSINEAAEHLKRVADEIFEKMNRLIGALPQQEQEAAPETEEPKEPQTAEEKVDALLQQLFTDRPQAPAAEPNAKPAELPSILDVLPAYLK